MARDRALKPDNFVALAEFSQPEAIGVERAVLGSLMAAQTTTLPPLAREDFYLEKHRDLWDVFTCLTAAGGVVSLISVHATLVAQNRLAAFGGALWFAGLLEEGCCEVPEAFHAYTRMIREFSRQREIIALGACMIGEHLLPEHVGERLSKIPPAFSGHARTAEAWWGEIQAQWGKAPVRFGMPSLDRLAGGLHPGDLVIVGGRTSHGKTALLVSAALSFLSEHPVSFLSLEMTAAGLFRRFLAAKARIRVSEIRRGSLGPTNYEIADATATWFESVPLVIQDVADIGSKRADAVIGAASSTRSPIVILDHLQEIATDGDHRPNELAAVLGDIKGMALREKKIVVLAAQLNRNADEQRRGPKLSDFKESGASEEKADIVLLLDYRAKRDSKAPTDQLDVIVAKNRDGATGKTVMHFLPEFPLVEESVSGASPLPSWITE